VAIPDVVGRRFSVAHALINPGFLSPGLASRFEFSFRMIDEWTVELTKVLGP